MPNLEYTYCVKPEQSNPDAWCRRTHRARPGTGSVGDHAGAIGADRGIDRTSLETDDELVLLVAADARERLTSAACRRAASAAAFSAALRSSSAFLASSSAFFSAVDLVSGTFRDSTPPQLSLSSELTDTVSLSRSLRAVFIFGNEREEVIAFLLALSEPAKATGTDTVNNATAAAAAVIVEIIFLQIIIEA